VWKMQPSDQRQVTSKQFPPPLIRVGAVLLKAGTDTRESSGLLLGPPLGSVRLLRVVLLPCRVLDAADCAEVGSPENDSAGQRCADGFPSRVRWLGTLN